MRTVSARPISLFLSIVYGFIYSALLYGFENDGQTVGPFFMQTIVHAASVFIPALLLTRFGSKNEVANIVAVIAAFLLVNLINY
jgi:hypothetical protein